MRRWIAISGATAAVAIGAFAAIAWAEPTGLTSPPFTNGAPHLTWNDGDATDLTGYDVDRFSGTCPPGATPDMSFTNVSSPFTDPSPPGNGIWCYRVTGHYGMTIPDSAASTQVMVDTTAPAVQLTSPAAGLVKGTVSIQATASDLGSGLSGGVVVSVDGLIAPHAPPLAWDTKTVGGDGLTYTVRAHATDLAGNSHDDTVTVVIDNTAPAGPTVSALQNPVPGSPTLRIDNYNAALTYTVSRNGVSQGSATALWTDPATLAPGAYDYSVVAMDSAGNASTATHVSITVIPPSLTAPRAISANSPTNAVPHVAWQPPVSFLVGGWNIYRDGSLLTTLSDPAASAFDDTGLAAQGAHTYAVQAVNGNGTGDLSSAVSVTFDTMAPTLAPATATANPDGSVSLNWPDATDPTPGSGLAGYVVRRLNGSSPPSEQSAGTAVCSPKPPANGCIDTSTKSGTSYAYGIFAIDAAGNVAFRGASARAVDTQAPDPVGGAKIVSFDRSYARIGWTTPALKGANADVAGYRVLELQTVGKPPLNPNDGRVVCRNDDPKDGICDVLNLVTGKKVSFAVYAYDGVPNYSTPVIVSVTPHNIDNTPPHKPTKVRLTHSGLTYTLRWVSPRDKDLSKFRVTLYDKKPPSKPSLGKAVVTGRVLHATFTVKPGKKVYVTLWALDVSGNASRVTKLIVPPGAIVPKSKHKIAKKKVAAKKPTAPAKTAPKKKTPPKKKEKPISVSIGNG